MSNPFLVFESADELESMYSGEDREYKNLPEDFYLLQIKSIEIQKDKTSQWQPEAHDEWKVGFTVISFQNGEPVYYQDGTEPEPGNDPYLVTFINPTKKGMVPRPSKARKFLTSALGLDVGARIELDSPEQLIGKRLIGRLIHKPDTKNPKMQRDRLEDFLPVRQRARPATAVPATEEVEANADNLLAKAAEIFGEDIRI